MLRSPALGASRRPLAMVTAVLLSLFWLSAGPLAAPASAATVGGFEIEGNLVDDPTAGVDWSSLKPGDPGFSTSVDNTTCSGQDDTTFKGASKEYNLLGESGAWPTWEFGSGNAAGKTDFGRWATYSTVSADQHVWLNLGFDRGSGTGTGKYVFELNQITQDNANNPNPVRSQGDVRLVVFDQGNGLLTLAPTLDGKNPDVGLYIWDDPDQPAGGVAEDTDNDGSWVRSTLTGTFVGAANTTAVTVPSWWTGCNVDSGSIETDQFAEFAIDLTSFGAVVGCPSAGFTTANARSITGTGGPGTLVDYLSALPISIPSDCATLLINKFGPGRTRLGGATFTISPNPIPVGTVGRPAADFITVYDDSVANTTLEGSTTWDDADDRAGYVSLGQVVPGVEYTITETIPPAGYVGETAPKTVIPAAYGSGAVSFTNGLGALAWVKTDANGGAKICGATFSLDRVKNAAGGSVDEAAVSVVDNCGQAGYAGLDEDADPGGFLVTGLKTGTYELKETAAPTGYTAVSTDIRTVVIDSTTTMSLEAAFTNTRRTVDVTLPKLFEGGAAPGVTATFTLYKDTDKDGFLDDAELAGGTPVTTDASGEAIFPGLTWGANAYYVVRETTVPNGFTAVADIAFSLVDFPDGGALTLATVTDPRKTVNVTLPKAFAGETSPYSVSATFTLFKDTNNNNVLDDSEKTNGITATTNSAGIATWAGLPWGSTANYVVTETVVPTGFTRIDDIAFDLLTYPDGGTYNLAVLNDGKPYVDKRDLATVVLEKSGATLSGGANPLEGSVFTLCSDSGADPNSYDPAVDTTCEAPTSGAGSATMTWTGLAWGAGKVYWLVEVSAPAGYLPVNPIRVNLTAFPEGGTKTVTTTDPRDTVDITLAKQDGGPTSGTPSDNSPLASAGFTLFLESGDSNGYQAGEDTTVAKGPEQVGADGAISWTGLAWGPGRIYYAVETTVPVGYVAVPVQTVDLTSFASGGSYSIGALVDERLPFRVQLTKFDGGYGTGQGPLAGAGFTLYTNADCDTVVDAGEVAVGTEHVSVADGSIPPWSGLAWGACYLLVETTVPAGYSAVPNILVDSRSGYPTNGVLTYDANDPRLLARIDVVKHDGSVSGPALAGAWFELRDTAGNVVQAAKQTGADGAVSFTDLQWGKTYVLRETIAPAGYSLVADRTIDLTNYPMGGVVTIDVPDPKLPATVTLVKKDGFDGTDLTTAVFTLYAESGATVGYQAAQDTVKAGGPASMVGGKITFTGLEWGAGKTYYAVETSTPTGYDTVAPIVVDLTSYPVGGTFAVGRVVDNRSPVTVNLLKLGTSPGDAADINLAGVGFTLYRDTGTIGVLDAEDAPVGTEQFTTADGRTSWTGLSWGAGQRYLLHESTPKPGYATVEDQAIDLTNYPVSGQGTVSYTLTDFRQQAELAVRKTGGDAALAGTQFDLYRDNGDGQFSAATDTVVGGCTTASAGLCTVTVDWGSSYFWYEKMAPAGYNLPTQQWQGPIAVTAANVTTTLPVTSFDDTRTGITTTPSAGPVVIAPQPGTSGSVQTVFDSATLTGLSRDATGTVTFQLFGPFTSAGVITCDTTPAFVSSGNAISLVGSSGAFVATSAVFTPKAAGLYQWRAIYTGDAKNVGITGLCPDATEQITVRSGPGPQVTKVADPATGSVVQPSSTIGYTVTVSNIGDVPIVNGPVVDTLPAGVAVVPGSISSGGVLSADARTITWSVNLAPRGADGASQQLTYRVTVNADAPRGAGLVNRVAFFDQQATTVHRTPTGDLTIVKTNSPSGTVVYGDSITYTMRVNASGTLTQTGVVVSDFVPGYDPGLATSLRTTYVPNSAVCDTGTCTVSYDATAKKLNWQLGSIAGGSSRTVSFTVTVDRPAAAADGSIAGGEVRNVAVVASTQTPPTPSNVVVNPVAAVPPTPTGALTVVKANDPTGAVAYGGAITYTMAVKATGTLAQTAVVVRDVIPGYDPADPTSLPTTYQAGSARCDGQCAVVYDEATRTLTWSLGDMAAGSTRTVSFAVTVNAATAAADGSIAAGEVRNAAVAQSTQTAPTRSNRVINPVTAVLGVKVAAPPVVEIPEAVTPVAQPVTQPAPQVLGVRMLPRTGPLGSLAMTLWWAAALLTAGLGLTVAGLRARKRAQHRI